MEEMRRELKVLDRVGVWRRASRRDKADGEAGSSGSCRMEEGESGYDIATVRYIGRLSVREAGNSSKLDEKVWVGVEWDEGSKGTHNGTFQGVRYFSCTHSSASSSTGAAFLQLNRIFRGVSFAEAVSVRYLVPLSAEEEEAMCLVDSVTGRKKRVQLVGKEQAAKFFQTLHSLPSLTLDNSGIAFAGSIGGSMKLSNVSSLSLDGNLLSGWEEVLAIVNGLPQLRVLTASNNRMRPLSEPLSVTSSKLDTLAVNHCHLCWAQVYHLCSAFPSLQTLSLSSNCLAEHSPSRVSCSCLSCCRLTPAHEALTTLVSLDLSQNFFTSWVTVLDVLTAFPQLHTLFLSDNHLSDAVVEPDQSRGTRKGDPEGSHSQGAESEESRVVANGEGVCPSEAVAVLLNGGRPVMPEPLAVSKCTLEEAVVAKKQTNADEHIDVAKEFSRVKHLTIDGNRIKLWQTLGGLFHLFGCLEQVRCNGNLVGEGENPTEAVRSFNRQMCIGMLPNLVSFNGGPISAMERKHGERYFLSLLAQLHPTTLALLNVPQDSSADTVLNDPIVRRLQTAHGAIAPARQQAGASAAKTMASSLIELHLTPDCSAAYSKGGCSKRLPCSMPIAELKMLCGRLFGLPALRVKLRYAEKGVPISSPLADENNLSYYGISDGCRIYVQDSHEDA